MRDGRAKVEESVWYNSEVRSDSNTWVGRKLSSFLQLFSVYKHN